jgi:hypothetical protein
MKNLDILAVLQVATNTMLFHFAMFIALLSFKRPYCDSVSDINVAVL